MTSSEALSILEHAYDHLARGHRCWNPLTRNRAQADIWRRIMSMNNSKSSVNAFEVVVGNVGTVYEGDNAMIAMCKFNNYMAISKLGDGNRAFRESVTLLHRGEVAREYAGRRLT